VAIGLANRRWPNGEYTRGGMSRSGARRAARAPPA